MPTGQAYCPPHIVEAERILEEIKKQAEIDTFEAVEAVVEEGTEPNEGVPSPVRNDHIEGTPVRNANVPVRNANVPFLPVTFPNVPFQNANVPFPPVTFPTSQTNEIPAVSPRLQRVSNPRKKTSPDDMSIQDFFKFSLMQREENRKDRMKREEIRERERREERERRDAEERMFRNMFMAVLAQGQSGKGDKEKE